MRYLPLNDADRAAMLARTGVNSIDDLFADIPAEARQDHLDGLPGHSGEWQVEAHLGALAAKNLAAGDSAFFIGGGAYRHHVPATVDHLLQRSEFLTAYTPYQPEIAQGTLQAMFEFQTQVARLTGMEVANASMYDGSTACAEAVLMAMRVSRRGRAVLSGGLHPHYRAVTENLIRHGDHEAVSLPPDITGTEAIIDSIDERTACVVVQTPNVFGTPTDVSAIAEAAHAAGALLVVAVTEAVSLGLLRAPGVMGADIVCGEGQSLGNALNFGGPYVGLLATRKKFLRQMPGRVVGETVDTSGRRGFVLTLSTREQHIRREKATSNICTNSGLCALAFTMHMTLLGGEGLYKLARLNHEKAQELARALTAIDGVELLNPAFFNEITLRLPVEAAPVVEALAARNILGGIPASRLFPEAGLDNLLLAATTELNTPAPIGAFAAALGEELS